MKRRKQVTAAMPTMKDLKSERRGLEREQHNSTWMTKGGEKQILLAKDVICPGLLLQV